MWAEKGRRERAPFPAPFPLPAQPEKPPASPHQEASERQGVFGLVWFYFPFNSLFWYIHAQPLPGGAEEGSPNKLLLPTPASAMGAIRTTGNQELQRKAPAFTPLHVQ